MDERYSVPSVQFIYMYVCTMIATMAPLHVARMYKKGYAYITKKFF